MTPHEIAASLTKAQREALIHAGYGGFGSSRKSLKARGRSQTIDALFLRGLCRLGGYLAPLGLAVRAILKE